MTGVDGLAIDCLLAPKQPLGKNFSITFLVVTTQIAKGNKLISPYCLLKLLEILNSSILRPNGVVWQREPAKNTSVSLGQSAPI
jgi:hypothetical protein